MDVVEAHEQSRILKPPKGVRAPHAVLTPFSWSIIGRLPTLHQNRLPSLMNIYNLTVSRPEEDLDALVKDQWSVESLGIRKTDKEILSPGEEGAMDILQATTRRVNGRYECGMLWKGVKRETEGSLPTAKARFAGLERRFRLDSDFASRYSNVINDYLQDGHAKSCPLDKHHRDRWFLPHHAVRNPNKPKGLRVVFDASARSNGVSLNDMLLTVPDMLRNLFGLLVRFREHPVAVSADIAKMFHQVRVREEDQSMLRFLWRQPGNNEPVRHLQMNVHIFGAVCSLSVCTYVLRKTAEDQRNKYPHTWQKVAENFYMDNYLDSFDSTGEAATCCQQLTQLLSYGGFRLTKWMSSSRLVLRTVDSKERSQPDLDISVEPCQSKEHSVFYGTLMKIRFIFDWVDYRRHYRNANCCEQSQASSIRWDLSRLSRYKRNAF
uniref:Reverse transcriptase domain-containing protein n=1 Tax=Trichuris muris TaxID=70415 RepID=A0A5S6Q6J9_TRIMR